MDAHHERLNKIYAAACGRKRRIDVALSACEGISTDSLTPGLVRRLRDALEASTASQFSPDMIEADLAFLDSIKVEE